MAADDTEVRLAAFRFLEEQLASDEGVLSRKVLVEGFVYDGQRVPLMGPQGIFKPRVLRDIPLSITTVAVVEGETRPYDDAFGEEGLLRYRYRGTDPQHHENVGLRLAMQRRVPCDRCPPSALLFALLLLRSAAFSRPTMMAFGITSSRTALPSCGNDLA
jgi:hypothetical protein